MTEGRMRRILTPQYVQQFSCIGDKCEDTCCRSWNISVDKGVYEKYQTLDHPQVGPLVRGAVVPNPDAKGDRQFASIKMGDKGYCPMLTPEKLCLIHKELGPDYLGTTCRSYPRRYAYSTGIIEKSLTTSCPEAARLALLNPAGIEFEETVEPDDGLYPFELPAFPSAEGEQYFWEPRLFAIQLLQTRAYSIEERLVALGLFAQELHGLVERKQLSKIPELVARFARLSGQGAFRRDLGLGESHRHIQLRLLMDLIKRIHPEGVATVFQDHWTEFLEGLKAVTGMTTAELAAHYDQQKSAVYLPFVDRHGYMIENYLVQFAFETWVPWGRSLTVMDSYLRLVLEFALLRLQLVGVGGFHGHLTPELAIRTTYLHGRIISHHTTLNQDALDLLSRDGLTLAGTAAIVVHL